MYIRKSLMFPCYYIIAIHCFLVDKYYIHIYKMLSIIFWNIECKKNEVREGAKHTLQYVIDNLLH